MRKEGKFYLFRVGSGSGCFEKLDLDPDKNNPDSQHQWSSL
jgi:hypothetical protein